MFILRFPDFLDRVRSAYQGNNKDEKKALYTEFKSVTGDGSPFFEVLKSAKANATATINPSDKPIKWPEERTWDNFPGNLSSGSGHAILAAALHYLFLCKPEFAQQAARMNKAVGFNPDGVSRVDPNDEQTNQREPQNNRQAENVEVTPSKRSQSTPKTIGSAQVSELNEIFMVACDAGKTDVIQALLDKGVGVNSGRASDGYNALMGASYMGHVDAVTLLLDRGANPNFKSNDDGWTALMAAARGNSSAVAKLLLDRGADIDQRRPNSGETALFIAIRNHSADMARLLLERGAETNLKLFDDNEWTVSKEAARAGNAEILHLIRDFTQRK
ncbi:MAG: ankyrin repeat domain-containing protein [Pseudomonadota bacterium]